MKFPLKVNPAPNANTTAGEPAWLVSDATGWPVCLVWKQQYAEQIVEAMTDAADNPDPPAEVIPTGVIDERCDNY